jgi:type I restriction enzyme, S subunit
MYGKSLISTSRKTDGMVDVYGSSGIVGKHDQTMHEGPSIVVGRKGSVGSAYYVPGPFWCIDTAFYLDAIHDQVSLEYLQRLLSHLNLQRLAIVSGVPGLNREELESIQIPLPRLQEQEQIVAILKQADEIRRLRHEGIDEAKKLYAASFLEMFGDPAKNPRKWPLYPFKKHITYTKYGPRFHDRPYAADGVRVLRTTDMSSDGTVRWWESPKLDLSKEEIQQHLLKPRTLLVSRSGTIGPVAVFDGASEPCVAGAYLIEFGLSETVDPDYVKFFFLSEYGQRLLVTKSRSATQANLNAPTIQRILMPEVEQDLQVKFSKAVKHLSANIERLVVSHGELEKLSSQIISEAFTGNMTASWRENHSKELEASAHISGEVMGGKKNLVAIKEAIREHRPWMGQTERMWVKDQMSELQFEAWSAMREWKGTLIPYEQLDEFKKTWPTEHVENTEEQILRALKQLAGLGLIAKISIPNEGGEYIRGYRGFREEEFSRLADLETLTGE